MFLFTIYKLNGIKTPSAVMNDVVIINFLNRWYLETNGKVYQATTIDGNTKEAVTFNIYEWLSLGFNHYKGTSKISEVFGYDPRNLNMDSKVLFTFQPNKN